MSLHASPGSNHCHAGFAASSNGDGIISIIPARWRHKRTAVPRYGDVPVTLESGSEKPFDFVLHFLCRKFIL